MNNFEEKEYLYWLCHVPAIGAVKINKLYEYAGSFKRIYNMEGKEFERAGILNEKEGVSFEEWKPKQEGFKRELEDLTNRGISFVTPCESAYPKRLLPIYSRPMGIFFKGKLPDEDRPVAAVVGARNCTEYGKEMASYLSGQLAKAGVQIVSGLAYGIDAAGHRGALLAGGDTYGVLGCGINTCYPREHYRLYEQMAVQGGILTEFMPDEPPKQGNFPMRNRIISGISDVILVIEARIKSGSLITADLGLEQGKEIFALPGRVTDPLSEGCNWLISQGAQVLAGPEAVLEYFRLQSGKILRVYEKNKNGLAKNEKMVYSCLDLQPKNLEEIVSLSRLSVSDCMGALLELELGGLIVQTSHQYYGKKL